MIDTLSWRDIIEASSGFITIIISVVALIKSSKLSQNAALSKQHDITLAAMEKIRSDLQSHIIQDTNDIATLKANNLNVEHKLDRILDNLEQP